MRASPAFHVVIDRFGQWRAAVLAVCAIASGAWLAWMVSMQQVFDTTMTVALAIAGLVPIVLAASLARRSPLSLRWDTQRWQLGPAASRGEEPWSGRVDVAIDLGRWMLLRFVHEHTARRWRRMDWIPVQRTGMESSWHALRCAVYSSRPSPGLDASSARRDPPQPKE